VAERKVRGVQAAMEKINAKLRRSGLSIEASYRCADDQYKGQQMLMPVGQLVTFWMQRLKVQLLPGEIDALLRVFMAPGRLNHSKPGFVPSDDKGPLGEGGEAWLWKITYDHVRQLALAFPTNRDDALRGVGKAKGVVGDIAATCLEEVRDALAIAAEMRKPTPGRRTTLSWQDLLVEGRKAYVQEEYERVSKELAAVDDDLHLKEELEGQREFYEEQKRHPALDRNDPVPATVVLARLLKERVPVLPVTIHAAMRAAAEMTHHSRTGIAILHGKQEKYVKFDQPLPSSPSLLHVSCEGHPGNTEGPPWCISLVSCSEKGFVLNVESREPKIGWPEDLRMKYAAGSASGEVVIVPRTKNGETPRRLDRGKRQVEVTFPVALLGAPSLIRVETYVNPGADKIGIFLARMGLVPAAQIAHMSIEDKRALVIEKLGGSGQFTALENMSDEELGQACAEAESTQRLPQRYWWQVSPYTFDVGPTPDGFVLRVTRLPGSRGLQDPNTSKSQDAGDIVFATDVTDKKTLNITASWKVESKPEDKPKLALDALPLSGTLKPSIKVSRASAVGFAMKVRDKEVPESRPKPGAAAAQAEEITVKYEAIWSEKTVCWGRLEQLADFSSALKKLPPLPLPAPTEEPSTPAGVSPGHKTSDTALVRRCNERARFWRDRRAEMSGGK